MSVMAKLLFNLRHVPEDEADQVRALLTADGLDWYETSAGLWGLGAPGLWLRDADQYPRARALLDEYQQARREGAREHLHLHGRETFVESLRDRPGYVLPRLAAILAIVALVLALPWLLLR